MYYTKSEAQRYQWVSVRSGPQKVVPKTLVPRLPEAILLGKFLASTFQINTKKTKVKINQTIIDCSNSFNFILS